MAGETYDLCDGELGDGARVAEGGVEDGYAELRGGLEVDLVGADAETADYYEVLCGFEDTLCELGFGADTDNMDISAFRLVLIL